MIESFGQMYVSWDLDIEFNPFSLRKAKTIRLAWIIWTAVHKTNWHESYHGCVCLDLFTINSEHTDVCIFFQQWNKVIDGFSNVQFCVQFNKSDTNTTVVDNAEPPKLTDVIGKLHEKLKGDNPVETTSTSTTSIRPNDLV